MESRTLEQKRSEKIRCILEAAREVFAEVGFEGARVDEIARRAGVNKAMIYYRIGDKQSLYASVIHEVFSDTVKRISDNVKEGQSPEEKLKTYILNLAMTMEQHPYIPPIMLRELASGAQNFPEIAKKDIIHLLSIIAGIFEEGAKTGVFIKTNPLVIHMMIVGFILVYKRVETINAGDDIFPKDLKGMVDGVAVDVAETVRELILRAVRV